MGAVRSQKPILDHPSLDNRILQEQECTRMEYHNRRNRLLDSIKTLIETNVIGQQTTSVSAGSDSLTVAHTCAYQDGDLPLSSMLTAITETEAFEVQVMPQSSGRVVDCANHHRDITHATIIGQVGGQYLRNIYVGNRPVTPVFPCLW